MSKRRPGRSLFRMVERFRDHVAQQSQTACDEDRERDVDQRLNLAPDSDSFHQALQQPGKRIGIRREIEPLINVPLSILISGGLTLLGYVVAESFYHPEETSARAALGHNTLAVAIALFLIGFFAMVNRRKALTQVLGLLSLENGLFLAAISLTYGMPLVVEVGIFFDVLVAVMILGILVFRIGETFDSMDVSKLRKLRE